MFEKKRVQILYFLAFLLPILSWVICCVKMGIYPFGSRSIMTGDITYQFIDYLSYFKSIIIGNNDFKYTFSKTMGGDMAGFSAYYLASPFNYFLLLFSDKNLPIGFLIMIIIKSGLMGLSFFHFLSKRFGLKTEALIFSTTYALMGYIVIYYQLYAYFDILILLPLITLGIYSIYENPEKKLLYISMLFSAVLINYYVGWMVCIFCVLFFGYISFINGIKKDSTIAFIISSAIAGLLSAFNLISALLSMRGEKDNFNFGIYRNFRMIDLFSRFYPNSFKGNISNCLPNVYCGLLLLILLLVYFLNSNIKRKEKIASGLFLLFIIGNLYISLLNVIWHGLNQPIGFPYRYSFIVSFMIILLSYKGLISMKQGKKNIVTIIVFNIFFFGYSVLLWIKGSEVLNKKEIIISYIIVVVISILIVLYSTAKIEIKYLLGILFLIQFVELTINQANVFNYFDLADINEYQEYVETVGSMIEGIKVDDPSFYRIEKYFRRSHNDAMQFQYNGLSHYSSCEKKEYIKYMGKLGFRDNGNWSFYDSGSTTFVDCLFGIKYILSQYNTTGKPYERIYKGEEYHIFKNGYALPLLFTADKNVEDLDYNLVKDTFKFQNEIADSVNGKTNNIFIPIEGINKTLHNLTEEVVDDTHIYRKKVDSEEAYIEYEIPLNEKIAECYFSAPTTQKAEIWIDGYYDKDYFSQYSWNIYDLGTIRKHQDTTVLDLKLNDQELSVSGEYFYYEDFDAIDKWYQDVISTDTKIEKISSSHLAGSINAKEDKTYVLSIPYDEAWNIYIDGKKITNKKVLGIFLAADISSGSHNIELIYKPAGKTIGRIISFIVFAIFMVVILKEKYYILCIKNFFKKNKKKC